MHLARGHDKMPAWVAECAYWLHFVFFKGPQSPLFCRARLLAHEQANLPLA